MHCRKAETFSIAAELRQEPRVAQSAAWIKPGVIIALLIERLSSLLKCLCTDSRINKIGL